MSEEEKINAVISILDFEEDALLIGLLNEKIEKKYQDYNDVKTVTERELSRSKHRNIAVLRQFLDKEEGESESHREVARRLVNTPEIEMILKCKVMITKLNRKIPRKPRFIIGLDGYPTQY